MTRAKRGEVLDLSNCQVLVVGAGPVGLMLAVQLARHGVIPRVIDRALGYTPYCKALAVQARTVEIFSQIGIVDEALQVGVTLNAVNRYREGVRTQRIVIDPTP